MQLSLLDRLPTRADPGFGSARRIDLARGAWVELVPGWLSGHGELFRRLLAAADWERHRRQMFDRIVEVPRLVASFPGSSRGLRWNDEQTVELLRHRCSADEVRAVAEQLSVLAALLSRRYRRALTNISLACYRDGRDSVAYHGDKLGALRPDTVVAILSLGVRRKFLMRPAPSPAASGYRRSGTTGYSAAGFDAAGSDAAGDSAVAYRRTLSFSPGEGDLLVMGGSCQETWEHGVPKSQCSEARIAVMFREAVPNLRQAPRTPGVVSSDERRSLERGLT